MKKIIFISVCLAVFSYSNTAFGIDWEQWRIQEMEARAERDRLLAEWKTEQAERRAKEREAYNKALNEAYQQVESSRKAAELSAAGAQSKGRELAQLRKSMTDPGEIAAANRRVQEAIKNKAEQTARLASLQRWTDSINVQTDPSLGTAVRMNEEDLYKKISPAQFVTPLMYQQANRYRDAQKKELEELKEQLRILSTLSEVNKDRILVEEQIQSKAIFGLLSDLFDLPAPVFDKADKRLKVAYEKAKLAVTLCYTAQASPDRVELKKKANESVDNLASLSREIALDSSWTAKDKAKLEGLVNCMSLVLTTANFMIEQDSRNNRNPVVLPAEFFSDYIRLTIDLIGVYNPYFVTFGAFINLNERTNQYVHAANAIKQITKMKGQGIDAKEFIQDRMLQVNRDLEATERTIRAYELGDRK